MSNPPPPPIAPLPFGKGPDDTATREVDGDEVIDEDANDDLVTSADADVLATQAPEDQD